MTLASRVAELCDRAEAENSKVVAIQSVRQVLQDHDEKTDVEQLRENLRLAEDTLKTALELRRRVDREQWSVACPTCDMPAGRPCIDAAGPLPEHMNHADRSKRYAAEQEASDVRV